MSPVYRVLLLGHVCLAVCTRVQLQWSATRCNHNSFLLYTLHGATSLSLLASAVVSKDKARRMGNVQLRAYCKPQIASSAL